MTQQSSTGGVGRVCRAISRRWGAPLAAAALFSSALLCSTRANAQQTTFHLDRLEIAGSPEDGLVMWRPVTQPKPIFFGQLALGYSRNPLHTSNFVNADTDRTVLARNGTPTGAIQNQFTTYATLGVQFLNRFTLSVTLPATLIQNGGQPDYGAGGLGAKTTTFGTGGPTVGDTRIDARAVLLRTSNDKGALGASFSLFAPTGTYEKFGGDGSTSGMVMVQGEYDFNAFVLTANTGVHFRPRNSINDPAKERGLGIGNEWRWAVGGFVPIKGGKYRIGASVFGQTGITGDDPIIGDTFGKKRNTPIEWNVEGRAKFGPKDRWWAGLGGGTLIGNGYGAPDFRIVAMIGAYIPITDSDANSPSRKEAQREKWRSERATDTDKDGIPDDIDACPNEPEDHQGADPNDGCPLPPDRDGDGIPDQYDRCPDQPEDKDGIEDGDGCPEDDADHDGVPDVTDACPDVPGKPSPDPKTNGCPQFIKKEGSVVRVLQQVHFQFGSAKILPDSFPMLQEIADLLKSSPSIKKMSVEGHTDNKGKADLNKKLSQSRADSVMKWLTDHGVETTRLEAHGYGLERPIEDNATEKGRAANRRVEFKILEEEDPNKIKK
ncbi:OmpA family protein [Pendulispora albinea]|uniref:OmpA family protein n=1 Tax=Pendulispora albinea TaxID=2741071 RepID=A0ABZ2M578_9BACT